jgi:hypothetical protein
LHTHSTRSDGKIPPDEVIKRYRDEGYDFVALTDHFMERYNYPIVDTRDLRTDDFTTLIGAELHAPALGSGDLWHIVAVGLPLDFAPNRNGETGPELAARAADAGAFVGIAHPGWYSLTLEDALTLEKADAVEVFNATAYGHNGRDNGWYISDQFGAMNRRHSIYAADDAHFKDRPDWFGGWVQVRAESLDPDALLAALKAGHFYSSQSPEIQDISIDGDEIHVATSPVDAIIASGRGSVAKYLHGQNLTEATFPHEPFKNGFFRITVIDANRRRAWSNPVWLDEQ